MSSQAITPQSVQQIIDDCRLVGFTLASIYEISQLTRKIFNPSLPHSEDKSFVRSALFLAIANYDNPAAWKAAGATIACGIAIGIFRHAKSELRDSRPQHLD